MMTEYVLMGTVMLLIAGSIFAILIAGFSKK